jgi:RNA polymerase sigma factor (sigma-70 family)
MMLQLEEYYVSGIKQRNLAVFSQFRLAYHKATYHSVFRLVKQHQTAEEIVQDTFMKVWNHGPCFDPNKGRLYTWISQIARNSALDAIKSASFRRAKRNIFSEDALIQQEARTPDVHLFDMKDHALALPQKYAAVLTRYYFDGYSQEEISIELGIPIGTVKTRMREAVRRMHKHYFSGIS